MRATTTRPPSSILLFSALLLAACGDKEVEVDGPVRDTVVWSGSNYTWDLLSHRVSLIRTILAEDETTSLGLIGGDWSTGESFADTPMYRSHHQAISAKGFYVVHGETTLTVGPDGAASASESVSDATLLGMSEHVVVLRGYEINTDVAQGADYPEDYNPAYGYTSRGYGFSLSTPEVSGDTLTFEVAASVRWGVQDRSDMNAAIPYAQTGVRVAWTAIGFEGTLGEDAVSESVTYDHEPPYSEHPPVEAALGAGEGGVEVVGLRSFDLLMTAQDGSDEGDYLRAFGAEVVQAADGTPQSLRAECSNSSVLELLPIDLTVTASVARLALLDPDAAVVVRTVEGSHEVGEDAIASP